MKIIGAGFSKTGTKSLHAALNKLGYEVYDYLEHFEHHGEQWKRIFEGNGSIEDFKQMYQNVDAIVDTPVYYFWEEIHWAFPDAKIVLTIRDENAWYRSLCAQVDEINRNSSGIIYTINSLLLPTLKKYLHHINYSNRASLNGLICKDYFDSVAVEMNEVMARQRYRQHNAYVQMKAPKDKLLVFDVRDGWDPLCKFLGKEIPKTTFPHKNAGGKGIIPEFEKHSVGKQIEKEFAIFIAIACTVIGIGVCLCFKLYF